jgi:hypothetical protein
VCVVVFFHDPGKEFVAMNTLNRESFFKQISTKVSKNKEFVI